jgi:hypothetical protein
MLTREQALAAMDAQLIRVEAERKQRLERRVGRFRVLFPILRQVPLEAITDLVDQARKHALRQWSLYVVVALAVAVVSWFVLLRPWLGYGPPVRVNYFAWYFPAAGAVGFVVQRHMRAYLRRVVPPLYPKSED